MFLAAVEFTNTITLGAAIIAIAMAIVGVFMFGAARAWKSERDAEKDKADRLEEENHRIREELTALRARTDLSAIAAQLDQIESGMAGSFSALMRGFREQSDTAAKTALVLDRIARRLELNGGS